MSPRSPAWGASRRIADALRGRIREGEFIADGRLPSESSLCAEYGVARNTVRRALDQLAEEGLITAEPGRVRAIVSPGMATARAVPRYRRIAADLRVVIETGELPPGAALPSESTLAARYGVARGTARQALAELEGAGLPESVHGKADSSLSASRSRSLLLIIWNMCPGRTTSLAAS